MPSRFHRQIGAADPTTPRDIAERLTWRRATALVPTPTVTPETFQAEYDKQRLEIERLQAAMLKRWNSDPRAHPVYWIKGRPAQPQKSIRVRNTVRSAGWCWKTSVVYLDGGLAPGLEWSETFTATEFEKLRKAGLRPERNP